MVKQNTALLAAEHIQHIHAAAAGKQCQKQTMTTTKDVLLPLATSSLACSATLIELTIPQVVRLSRPTAEPLPATPLTARLAMLPRLLGPQTALTVVQFGCIRELRDAMDRWRGPHPLHLSLSYGLVSGPCRSAAYNLLIAGTYAHHGRAAPGDASLARFWRCLLYTSPSPRDKRQSRMPSSA